MIRKIVITLLTLLFIIFMPFAFIIASIYFTWKPEKIKEWNKEATELKDIDIFLKAKSENNSNTGLH